MYRSGVNYFFLIKLISFMNLCENQIKEVENIISFHTLRDCVLIQFLITVFVFQYQALALCLCHKIDTHTVWYYQNTNACPVWLCHNTNPHTVWLCFDTNHHTVWLIHHTGSHTVWLWHNTILHTVWLCLNANLTLWTQVII